MTSNKKQDSKAVTLLDVAEAAGVSRSTASLVVRNSPLVAVSTRQRVLKIMHQLGYVQNRAAASLRSHQSYTIGQVVTDITNPFFAQMTLGSEEIFNTENYAVLLANSSDNVAKQERLLETMVAHRVDGLILCPAKGTSPEQIRRLLNWHVPVVLVVRYLSDIALDYVGADNLHGAKLAASYLLGQGHRRIAFIGGPEGSSARHDRLNGLHQVLKHQGVGFDASLSATSPVTRNGGLESINKLLRLADPPTAALCYNDIIAFGVMLGLQSQNLLPGRDFAVVGFDDIEEAALWHPPLTTIAISPMDIGTQAAQLLLDQMEHPDRPPKQVILSPELIVRASA